MRVCAPGASSSQENQHGSEGALRNERPGLQVPSDRGRMAETTGCRRKPQGPSGRPFLLDQVSTLLTYGTWSGSDDSTCPEVVTPVRPLTVGMKVSLPFLVRGHKGKKSGATFLAGI